MNEEVANFSCGVCGIVFESEEDYEKHIFHYKGERWCERRLKREKRKGKTKKTERAS